MLKYKPGPDIIRDDIVQEGQRFAHYRFDRTEQDAQLEEITLWKD